MGCVVSAPPKAIKLSAKTPASMRTTLAVNAPGVFCCYQEESSRCLGQGRHVLRYLEPAPLKTCVDMVKTLEGARACNPSVKEREIVLAAFCGQISRIYV